MRNARQAIRSRAARQFARFWVWYPGMTMASALAAPSIAALALTEGRQGRAPLLMALLLLLMLLLLARLAYMAARWNPRLARRQITRFIKDQEAVRDTYQKALSDAELALANLERTRHALIRDAWDGMIYSLRQEALARLQEVVKGFPRLERVSPQEELRHHPNFAKVRALIQEAKSVQRGLKDLPIPPMPQEFAERVRQVVFPQYGWLRDLLHLNISSLREGMVAADVMVAEARGLL